MNDAPSCASRGRQAFSANVTFSVRTHLTNPSFTMSRDDCQPLLNEFRQHLEDFYAVLHLAPPYHSIEQAIACLSALTDTKTDDQRKQLLVNPILRRELYGQAFTDSGLHKKHRGIIAGRARTQDLATFPNPLRFLLEPFRF